MQFAAGSGEGVENRERIVSEEALYGLINIKATCVLQKQSFHVGWNLVFRTGVWQTPSTVSYQQSPHTNPYDAVICTDATAFRSTC